MIPRPQSFEASLGTFSFARPLALVLDETLPKSVEQAVDVFLQELAAFGIEARKLRSEQCDAGQARIVFGALREELGEEAYQLSISSEEVFVMAASAKGAFYATRTLLLEAGSSGKLQAGSLKDEPRYRWRGAHLDVARHFFPVESVKRFIDLLAIHKMNVFHWHLTEDQGWRIQIDAFPQLTDIAAWRKEGEGRYGGFYTKDEVREVLAYAAERCIEVIPEIEMPGHAVAALAAYPQLSCTGGPFEVETQWGIFDDVYCVGQDETLDFLERVVDEVLELFDSPFFHIGADECPKVRWKTCEKCQERMRQEGLASEEELQSWFVSRMSRYLGARGRRLVGWDEILEGGLAPGATVMSWRGTEGGIRAAQMNHDVVMSPTSHCYFDYKQVDEEEEPGAWFGPALDLETVYSYDPTPANLSLEEATHILGVQANVWTEKMPSFKQVEYMTFPRLCALAEVAWSSSERDFSDFQERLLVHERFLDRLNVGYRGSALAEPLRPSLEDQQRYKRAQKDREGQAAAY